MKAWLSRPGCSKQNKFVSHALHRNKAAALRICRFFAFCGRSEGFWSDIGSRDDFFRLTKHCIWLVCYNNRRKLSFCWKSDGMDLNLNKYLPEWNALWTFFHRFSLLPVFFDLWSSLIFRTERLQGYSFLADPMNKWLKMEMSIWRWSMNSWMLIGLIFPRLLPWAFRYLFPGYGETWHEFRDRSEWNRK